MNICQEMIFKIDEHRREIKRENKEISNIVFKKSKRERERDLIGTLSIDDRKSRDKKSALEVHFKVLFKELL